MAGTELHNCDKLKALFKSQNWLAVQGNIPIQNNNLCNVSMILKLDI